MISVAAPTWPEAVRGTVTARQASAARGARRPSRGVMLRPRRAADREARLSRGPGRNGDGLRVGTRDRAIPGHAAERDRVVSAGNPGGGDAVVRADGARFTGVQCRGVAGREVRPGGGRRDGEVPRGRRGRGVGRGGRWPGGGASGGGGPRGGGGGGGGPRS